MFTSKKAQYLNKDFDRISPITNIDTLYYEQAEKSKDTGEKYKYCHSSCNCRRLQR